MWLRGEERLSRKKYPPSQNDRGEENIAEKTDVGAEEEVVTPSEAEEDKSADPSLAEEAPVPDVESLLAEIEQLRSEKAELNDRWLRAQADFDNFRKRSRQQQIEQMKYANERLISALLPVIDNLERALQAEVENGNLNSWRAGVEMIARQLAEVLQQHGVRPIETEGQMFDPARHEAVGSVETMDVPESQIVEELEKGYFLHDRLLRPAKVRVAKRPPETTEVNSTEKIDHDTEEISS